MKFYSFFLHIIFISCIFAKRTSKFRQRILSAKLSNPNYVHDRFRDEIYKPVLPTDYSNRFKLPWKPSYMDHCDPKHCDSYTKQVCGANSAYHKYRWFQSGCHLELNNFCANDRGTVVYTEAPAAACQLLVLSLRSTCPRRCPRHGTPVCAQSNLSGHTVVFGNRCLMLQTNCDPAKLADEFEEVSAIECLKYLYSEESSYSTENN